MKASCVTCHEDVLPALTERGALLPLAPEVARGGQLALRSAGPGSLPIVRYLRGSAFLHQGEVYVTAHWNLHPECKPAKPAKRANQARWEHLTKEVATA